MNVRPASESDLPEIARIFDVSSRWLTENYRPDQVGSAPVFIPDRDALYRHLLSTGAVFVAEESETVGFSAAIVRDRVWFLSLLWVDPERHGAGAGSTLLKESLAWGRGAAAFSVVASPYPVAQLIYMRSSMYPVYTQLDMAGPSPQVSPIDEVEDLREEDQQWVDGLDREVRGTARPEDHAFWRAQAKGLALRRDGSALGYVYAWPDGKIGPGAAREPSDGPILLRAAAAAIEPRAERITVALPSPNWSVLREAIRLGMAPIGSNMFMASQPLGDPARYISSGGALS